jgi:simple sugar transport system permease protein
LHPIWSIPASILFGALLVGANKMQRVVQVPSALVIALNGLVVVFVVSSEIWRRRRQRRRLAAAKDDDSPPDPDSDIPQLMEVDA